VDSCTAAPANQSSLFIYLGCWREEAAKAAPLEIRTPSLSYKFQPSTQPYAENLRSEFEIFPNFGEWGRRPVWCRLRDRASIWYEGCTSPWTSCCEPSPDGCLLFQSLSEL